MKKYCIYFFLSLLGFTKLSAQDSIAAPKSFFNLGFFYNLSTNGELTESTTNNISLSLLYNRSANVYGFSFAPINIINSSSKGLQLGIYNEAQNVSGLQLGPFNGSEEMRGLQIGFCSHATLAKGVQMGVANITKNISGVQIGMMNETENISGLQIGFFNEVKTQPKGLQIGIVNSASHNDYPIGLVNIIKDGEMAVGITMDELTNTIASFRSGGKYLYGIVGMGYNFDSPHHHMVLEGGFGLHIPFSQTFRLNTEFIGDVLTKVLYHPFKEVSEEERDDYDYKEVYHCAIRLMPSCKISKKIEFFGGPSINYLRTNTIENLELFPRHHIWQKFESTSYKQIYWGWTFGVQYKL